MSNTFTTKIQGSETVNATGIEVPADVVLALASGKRPKVVVTLNGYSYRSTVMPYDGVNMIPLCKEHREAAGVSAGEEIAITLALDTEPRTVEVPEDLRVALVNSAGWEKFETLSYTNRKEAVRSVEDAKTQETREKRIAKVVTQCSA
ncbi:MAG: YdeI/OmpD-associated family protein [Fimbriimonadaceae bacterium]